MTHTFMIGVSAIFNHVAYVFEKERASKNLFLFWTRILGGEWKKWEGGRVVLEIGEINCVVFHKKYFGDFLKAALLSTKNHSVVLSVKKWHPLNQLKFDRS